ncbi:MAG: STAS domain-containing protein [Planctomycetota bacterium]|jgi:anti-anti-sigma factor
MAFTVQLEHRSSMAVTFKLAGKIDSEAAAKLDQQVTAGLAGPVRTAVFDMEGVDFIASAGVGILMKAKATLTRKGGDLAMINLQPQIKKVFEIIQMLPALNVFESVAELDNYLTKIQDRIVEEGDSVNVE